MWRGIDSIYPYESWSLTLLSRLEFSGRIMAYCSLELLGSNHPPTSAFFVADDMLSERRETLNSIDSQGEHRVSSSRKQTDGVWNILYFYQFFHSVCICCRRIFCLLEPAVSTQEWKFSQKMQLHGKGSPDSNTKVHIKALQTVTSFLLLFAVYFLSLITSIWNFRRRL
nr:taste receptor type 2 member 14 isoform X3 [Pan paniscus]